MPRPKLRTLHKEPVAGHLSISGIAQTRNKYKRRYPEDAFDPRDEHDYRPGALAKIREWGRKIIG